MNRAITAGSFTDVYYRPSSVRARLCVERHRSMIDCCRQHELLFEPCGKVIVTSAPEQLARLEELRGRGVANCVQGLRVVSRERLCEIESCVEGIVVLYSPNTCIVDYKRVATTLAGDVGALGGMIALESEVVGVSAHSGSIAIETTSGLWTARYAVALSGPRSDRNPVTRRASASRPRRLLHATDRRNCLGRPDCGPRLGARERPCIDHPSGWTRRVPRLSRLPRTDEPHLATGTERARRRRPPKLARARPSRMGADAVAPHRTAVSNDRHCQHRGWSGGRP